MQLHEHPGLEFLDPDRFSPEHLATIDPRTLSGMLEHHRRTMENHRETWPHLVPRWETEIAAMTAALGRR